MRIWRQLGQLRIAPDQRSLKKKACFETFLEAPLPLLQNNAQPRITQTHKYPAIRDDF
jgi:hypothetical protein